MRDAVLHDLHWAIRSAIRRPLMTVTIVATLAIATAALTTAYGLAAAILWRPLPFADASALVFVWEAGTRDGVPSVSRVTASRYAAWRDTAGVFTSTAAFRAGGYTLDDPDGAASLRGVRVTANYFQTLGIAPALGRLFQRDDHEPGRGQVVILSHGFWQTRFGGRGDVVGSELRLSGTPFIVIGVMPEVVFPGWPVNPARVTLEPEARQIWVPLEHTPELEQNARSHLYGVVARLAPGMTPDAATAALGQQTRPDAPDPHLAHVTPLREQFVDEARVPLLLLIATTIAVLLVACANLAALAVSGVETRRAELAMRAALGAGRWRLIRQLGLEAALLATISGAAAIALAAQALPTVPRLLPSSVPFLTEAGIDWRVALFGLGVTLLTGALLAAWPIARVAASPPMPHLRATPGRGRVYAALVVAQLAVTVTVAASASLLMQSLANVRSQDAGFAIDGVLVADVGLSETLAAELEAVVAFEQRLHEEAARLRGVMAFALAYDHPLEANWSEAYTLSGAIGAASDEAFGAEMRIVSPGYFDALGVEIVDGRAFTDAEGVGERGVVVVNEAFAREHGGRVLGRLLTNTSPNRTWGDPVPESFAIVGIVEDERFRGLEAPSRPAFYLSTRQFPQPNLAVLARTDADARAVAADLRTLVRRVSRAATIGPVVPLRTILDEQLVARRVTTNAIGGLAGVALTLAALGVYGLLAVLVASRTREIGVRLAVGAAPANVAAAVIRRALGHATLGVAIGLVLAAIAGRALESLLVGVSGRDPATLGTVAALLFMVAMLAAAIPAWRAARVDPMVMLRQE